MRLEIHLSGPFSLSVASIPNSSSVRLIRGTASATPEPGFQPVSKDSSIITLRFDHLKYFFQAAAATNRQATNMPSTPLTPDQLAKAERQHSALQQRIKENVRAFVSGKWDTVRLRYKPQDPVVNADSMWINTVKQQEELMATIDTAKEAKAKGDQRVIYDLIMDIRGKFPVHVRKIRKPEKPTPPNPKEIEKSATRPPSSIIPETPPPAYQPNRFGRPDPFTGLSFPTAPARAFRPSQDHRFDRTKRKSSTINVDDTDASSDYEAEDNASEDPKDSSFDPTAAGAPPTRHSREERAAKRQRNKGTEFATKVKNATSREELMFQLAELRIQMRLKEIVIQKKLKGLEGKSSFELEEEEILKQFEMKKLHLGKRKRVAAAGEEGQ